MFRVLGWKAGTFVIVADISKGLIATMLIAIALVVMAVVRTQRLIRQEDALLWALRASRERYDYAISGTNDGIFDWTLAARAFYVSPRFEELLGYASGSLHETAATFVRRIHPHERRRALGPLRPLPGRCDQSEG